MQNLGYAKAQIVSKYRFLTPKTILNHWLLTLSVRFCPKYALTPITAVLVWVKDNNGIWKVDNVLVEM